jgi:hypothetical protein
MSALGKAFDAASKGLGKTASVVGDAVPQLPSVPKVPWGWIIGAGVVVFVLSQESKRRR